MWLIVTKALYESNMFGVSVLIKLTLKVDYQLC